MFRHVGTGELVCVRHGCYATKLLAMVETVKPKCSTLEDGPSKIAAGELIKNNPHLLK
jgi:hypothetical protein